MPFIRTYTGLAYNGLHIREEAGSEGRATINGWLARITKVTRTFARKSKDATATSKIVKGARRVIASLTV